MLNSKSKGPSPLSPADVIRLHEFEMTYPMATILQFREVAVAVFNAQELFLKRKKKKRKGGNFSQALSWRDVLSMLTILKEEQRGVISYVSPAPRKTHAEAGEGHDHIVDMKDSRSSTEAPVAVRSLQGSEHDAALMEAVVGSIGSLERGSGEVSEGISENLTTDVALPVVDEEARDTNRIHSETQEISEETKSPVDSSAAVSNESTRKAAETAVATTVGTDTEKKSGNSLTNLMGMSFSRAGSSTSGTAVTPPPPKERDSFSGNATKLFSSIRHSASTPDSALDSSSHSTTASMTPPSAKVTPKSASTRQQRPSSTPRKSAMLSTMSAALTGKGSGARKEETASHAAAPSQPLGESRFNTLLARTLHLSESTDENGMIFDMDSNNPKFLDVDAMLVIIKSDNSNITI